MPELYKIADAMLATLEDKPYANMAIPGKVQSYMVVGKPIIGAINGACANFIINNDIGYVCTSADAASLAELIKQSNIDDLRAKGAKSKETYFRKYSKDKFITTMLDRIKAVID